MKQKELAAEATTKTIAWAGEPASTQPEDVFGQLQTFILTLEKASSATPCTYHRSATIHCSVTHHTAPSFPVRATLGLTNPHLLNELALRLDT